MEVNIHEAKTNLSRLIQRAENGEEIIIARAGKPAVRLVPVPPKTEQRFRVPGRLKGKLGLPDDWEAQFKAMDKELEELMVDAPLSTNVDEPPRTASRKPGKKRVR
jgi:prevent-host-death family protein